MSKNTTPQSSWSFLSGKLWQCGDVSIWSTSRQHRWGRGCEETPAQHCRAHTRLWARDRDLEIPSAREYRQVQRRLLQCRYSRPVVNTFTLLMLELEMLPAVGGQFAQQKPWCILLSTESRAYHTVLCIYRITTIKPAAVNVNLWSSYKENLCIKHQIWQFSASLTKWMLLCL